MTRWNNYISLLKLCNRRLRAINSVFNIGLNFNPNRTTATVSSSSIKVQLQVDPKTIPMDKMDRNVYMRSLNEISQKEFLSQFDVFVFDCDGVIWMGNTPINNAVETIHELRKKGKKVFFLTNNSTKTKPEFLAKFTNLGFGTTIDEIISTSNLAANYLKDRNFDKKVYVIGSTGVTNELKAAGIRHLPIGSDLIPNDMQTWISENLVKVDLDPEVGAVIVGFDHHISYPKLFKAASYLANPECIFIATNTDERFPSNKNLVVPGTGAIVNAVRTAAQRDPIIMGKPNKYPFEYLKKIMPELDPSRVLMIGDRANTDICFGKRWGMWTLLVLSGVNSLDDIKKYETSGNPEEEDWLPNFYTNSIQDLLPFLDANPS